MLAVHWSNLCRHDLWFPTCLSCTICGDHWGNMMPLGEVLWFFCELCVMQHFMLMLHSFLCIQQNPELGQFNENTDKFVLHSLASAGLWNISMCQWQESVEREHLSGLHKSTDANKREGINQEAFAMATIKKKDLLYYRLSIPTLVYMAFIPLPLLITS